MPRLQYAEDMDNLLPTTEIIAAMARETGLDTQYNRTSLFNYFVRPHEGTMAEYFLESQDPWDDDWGN